MLPKAEYWAHLMESISKELLKYWAHLMENMSRELPDES